MSTIQTTSELAAMMAETYGARANVIVAKRERDAIEAGNASEAEDWRKVRAAIQQMQGPRST
jgi:hypothetical protein